MKKKIKLDPLGQLTASTVSEKQPSSFMLTAYLKDVVDLKILQQAVNDVMGKRLPFISGRLKRGFFWYSQELLPPPQIVPDIEPHRFHCYFNEKQGHVMRVLYGERHFSVENIHSNVDGRGLLKVMQTLLVRYFEILGVLFDKSDLISCAETPSPEEEESGYKRYYNPEIKQPKNLHKQLGRKPDAYFIKRKENTAVRVIKHCFDLTNIKIAAKANNCSISEYILAHIFLNFAANRNINGRIEPITSILAIDLRTFFRTKSIRNFVGNATIIMPETNDFSEMIAGLHNQFANIDVDCAQRIINEIQGAMNVGNILPFALKKWIIRLGSRNENPGITTTFSNLGKVMLPPEIEKQLEHLEFVIDLAEEATSCFSCVTVANVLSLTVSVASLETELIANRIIESLSI